MQSAKIPLRQIAVMADYQSARPTPGAEESSQDKSHALQTPAERCVCVRVLPQRRRISPNFGPAQGRSACALTNRHRGDDLHPWRPGHNLQEHSLCSFEAVSSRICRACSLSTSSPRTLDERRRRAVTDARAARSTVGRKRRQEGAWEFGIRGLWIRIRA